MPDEYKASILIVDDTPANLRLLSQMLAEQGYRVRAVISGARALATAQAAPPDLILLDINMPEMNGYETCERLKADEHTHSIPIIFISALDDTQDKVKAFTVGGLDYITKPFQFEEVLARVETHLSLRQLQKQLEQEIVERDKLIAELDAYAHTVAHDLKNPLTTLVGFSKLLEKRFDRMSEDKLGEYLGLIAQNGRKMTNIIDELLLLSSVRKIEDIKLKPLDMAQIIQEALGRLNDMISEYQAEIAPPETEHWLPALGHAPWLEEVWVNYISNALKYGGQPPQVTFGADELPDGYVRFWLHDNGDGLTPEEQARLFVPFERLEQVRAKGHGLGLSIVRRIVEKLGGEVGVESQDTAGQGSTFFFTLSGVKSDE